MLYKPTNLLFPPSTCYLIITDNSFSFIWFEHIKYICIVSYIDQFLKIYISILVPVPHCWIGFITYSIISKLGPIWASQVAPVVKNPPANAVYLGVAGSVPGLGIPLGEGNSNPLWYFCLENLMDRGAWWATVHRVAKSRTQLKWLSTHARRAYTPSFQFITLQWSYFEPSFENIAHQF